MKAHQITITDPEHLCGEWASPAPYTIEATACDMRALPSVPVVVHICEGIPLRRAIFLLREVASSLERNGDMWLPKLKASWQNMQSAPWEQRDATEKYKHAVRRTGELEEQVAAIRRVIGEEQI